MIGSRQATESPMRRVPTAEDLMAKRTERGKGYYMISAVSQKYGIHAQTLLLYEHEGL